MNLNTLPRFRHEVYGCFARAADALFNTVDALLTETQAHSFPELSLSPWFERCWCTHGLRNEVAPWRESAPQPLSFTPRAQGWWILLACVSR